MRITILNLSLFNRIVSLSAFLLIALSTVRPLQAQPTEAGGMNVESPAFVPGAAEIRPRISATLASWDSETLRGLIAVHYEYPEGYHQIDNPVYFTLKPEPVSGVMFGPPIKAMPLFRDGIAEYYDETTILIEFQATQNVRSQPLAINALSQICNYQGVCLLPDSELQYVNFDPAAPTILPSEATLAILDWSTSRKEAITELASAVIPTDTGASETGIGRVLLILLMALVGGILLNVMPCILPLLSVKSLNLVKQAGQKREAIFAHSLLYVAGIEVSLLALAAIVIALQTSGRRLGWGFQFQSPLFVLILIAIIWIFALSLFGVFVVEAPRVSGRTRVGKKSGFWDSFLTGMFAVLLAAPCTAPLLGVVLGFAFSQTALMIIAIFGLIGLGFGLPFFLLGIGLGNRLPKPGAWMNTFKEAMGFVLIGVAVNLLTTFIKLAPEAVGGAFWWLLFLGLSAWLLGRARSPLAKNTFRIIGQIMALVIAVGSGFLFVDLSQANVTGLDAAETSQRLDEGVNAELPDRVNTTIAFNEQKLQTLIAAGRPVFLEFSADWCTICKINQRVIQHKKIRSLMVQRGITHMKADLTTHDEELTRALAGYGRASVPLYVLYRPEVEKPHIFPASISVQKLSTEMKKIR